MAFQEVGFSKRRRIEGEAAFLGCSREKQARRAEKVGRRPLSQSTRPSKMRRLCSVTAAVVLNFPHTLGQATVNNNNNGSAVVNTNEHALTQHERI